MAHRTRSTHDSATPPVTSLSGYRRITAEIDSRHLIGRKFIERSDFPLPLFELFLTCLTSFCLSQPLSLSFASEDVNGRTKGS
jgi:hypothetical protein